MTIQIELEPELEEKLADEAQSRGMAVEGYAVQILRAAIAANRVVRQRASLKEFEHFLDALARGGTKGAPANVDSFSREMIYDGHD